VSDFVDTRTANNTTRYHALEQCALYVPESPTSATVVLETSHPAAYVRVEVPGAGSWSDNGVFMRPGRPLTLTFTAAAPIAGGGGGGGEFLSSLTITSLANVIALLQY